jgi:hypothetical protein
MEEELFVRSQEWRDFKEKQTALTACTVTYIKEKRLVLLIACNHSRFVHRKHPLWAPYKQLLVEALN